MIQVFTGAIASGASTVSFALDKSWATIYAEVGTMSTGAAIAVYGGANSTTFYQLNERTNTATVQHQALFLYSAAVANGGLVPVPAGILNYQFRASAVVSGGVVFKLVCSD